MIQQTDQLVELSLDQQIYDLIDAAGSKGATFREVGIGSCTCLIDSVATL
jgi:general transcription factor 3C polypeptide 1